MRYRFSHLFFFLVALLVGCTSPGRENHVLSNVFPDSIQNDHSAPIAFNADYEAIIVQDVGCSGPDMYVDAEYDVYARKNTVENDSQWFYLCSGTLDLETQKTVTCTLNASEAVRLESMSHYDVKVQGVDLSSYVGLNALHITFAPLQDSEDTGQDTGLPDSDDTDDSDDTNDTDGNGGINQMSAQWTDTTPDFNGALEMLWNLEETIDNENGCFSGQFNDDVLFDVLWNDEGLFVGVLVPDAVNTWSPTDDLRLYDAVTIFIDVLPLGGTFAGNDNWFIFDSNGERTLMYMEVALIDAAGVVNPASYSIEIGIPWSSLGITPTAGMSLGFDVLIHDNDNLNNDCNMYWNSYQTGIINNNYMGRIILE